MDLAFMTLWEAGYLPLTTAKKPPKADPPAVKGACRYCGKKLGRGIHFHEKACKSK